MKRQQVTIKTSIGPRTIWASVSGPWAMHLDRARGEDGPGWTVTHVPTGCAVICGLNDGAEARAVVDALHALGVDDDVERDDVALVALLLREAGARKAINAAIAKEAVR